MDPAILVLVGVSLLAVVISTISVGLVKKYDPNQILYWHLNRNGDVEGFEDTNRESKLLLSKNYGRYGSGIVKGILYRGTLHQSKKKLRDFRKIERLIARAIGESFEKDISISDLNSELVHINVTEQKLSERLYNEIIIENQDLFYMLKHDPEVGNVDTFESEIRKIIENGIRNGKTIEEIKIRARQYGYSI